MESSTGILYECRILYAYYNDTSNNVDTIKWRVYVDQLKLNLILSTFLIKKLLLNNYSNTIIKINISNKELINETKNNSSLKLGNKKHKSKGKS